MANEGWEIIRLELKYCERCGGLWLRQQGTGRVVCAACVSEVSDFPHFGRRISRPRLPVNARIGIDNRNEAVRFSGSDEQEYI
jgi:Zn-finger nucleic acid-binding protein